MLGVRTATGRFIVTTLPVPAIRSSSCALLAWPSGSSVPNLQVGAPSPAQIHKETNIFKTTAVWLKWWSEANEIEANKDVGMYMGLYTFFSIFGVVAIAISCW